MGRRVVITGLAAIASNGIGKEEFWKNSLKGVSVVEHVPETWRLYSETESTIWSPLPAIDFSQYKISRIESMQMDMVAKLSCAAASMALEDAGFNCEQADVKKNTYRIDGIDPARWGVLWGTGAGGLSTLIGNNTTLVLAPLKHRLSSVREELQDRGIILDEVMQAQRRLNPFGVSMFMPNSCSAGIGIKYSLNGINETLCSACAAGTVAVGRAFSDIQRGVVDCAVSGGSEYLGDSYGLSFLSFDLPKALVGNCDDPATANRPFDTGRSGFLFSEGGAAALILEELSHALDRNASIYGEILSFSETFDAFSIMAPEPSGRQVRRMIGNCLEQASLCPGDIDYVNSHGTGTEQNDEIEAGILLDIFGNKALVNSTKSLIGHTIGASGAIEAVVTALSVSEDTTHVCNNLENPVNGLNFVRGPVSSPIDCALTHSFAFGGHNAGLVIGKYRV